MGQNCASYSAAPSKQMCLNENQQQEVTGKKKVYNRQEKNIHIPLASF